MDVSCGGCLPLMRALRYGASVSAASAGRSIVEVGSGGAEGVEDCGAAVLFPPILSLTLFFSACSIGQFPDQTS